MALSFIVRIAAVVAVIALAPSLLYAATPCSTLLAASRPPVSALAAVTEAEALPRLRECVRDCDMATLQEGKLQFALPSPAHWPAVSSTDEVAAWHVEIFERLTDARSQPDATQVCEARL
jgi:hypothetical protein